MKDKNNKNTSNSFKNKIKNRKIRIYEAKNIVNKFSSFLFVLSITIALYYLFKSYNASGVVGVVVVLLSFYAVYKLHYLRKIYESEEKKHKYIELLLSSFILQIIVAGLLFLGVEQWYRNVEIDNFPLIIDYDSIETKFINDNKKYELVIKIKQGKIAKAKLLDLSKSSQQFVIEDIDFDNRNDSINIKFDVNGTLIPGFYNLSWDEIDINANQEGKKGINRPMEVDNDLYRQNPFKYTDTQQFILYLKDFSGSKHVLYFVVRPPVDFSDSPPIPIRHKDPALRTETILYKNGFDPLEGKVIILDGELINEETIKEKMAYYGAGQLMACTDIIYYKNPVSLSLTISVFFHNPTPEEIINNLQKFRESVKEYW